MQLRVADPAFGAGLQPANVGFRKRFYVEEGSSVRLHKDSHWRNESQFILGKGD